MDLKKLYKLGRFILFNAVSFGFAYYAVIEKVDGAKNMTYFLVGGGVILALLCSVPDVIRSAARAAEEPILPSVPLRVSFAVDMALTAFFVWHAWTWCAIGVLVTALLQANFMSQLRTLSQQNIIDRLSA